MGICEKKCAYVKRDVYIQKEMCIFRHTHIHTHTHTHAHTHTQVDVTFDLDANGILTVTAQDQVTKAKADIKITQVAILKS